MWKRRSASNCNPPHVRAGRGQGEAQKRSSDGNRDRRHRPFSAHCIIASLLSYFWKDSLLNSNKSPPRAARTALTCVRMCARARKRKRLLLICSSRSSTFSALSLSSELYGAIVPRDRLSAGVQCKRSSLTREYFNSRARDKNCTNSKSFEKSNTERGIGNS